MSGGVYAADKVYSYPERLRALQAGRDIYPVHLHLVLSDLCNLDCPGCAYRMSDYSNAQRFVVKDASGAVNRNPNRFLSTELVKQVLDDCVVMGTQGIEFTGGGEPTVHKHCRELLEYAQDLGLDTALITNGLKLQEMGDAAVRTRWLRISIDAATAMAFGAVRPSLGGPQGHQIERVLEAARWAVERRNALGTDCLIGAGFVVQEDNWREIYAAVELYKSLGVDNVRISGLFSAAGDQYLGDWRDDAVALERKAVADFDEDGFRVHGRLSEKLVDLEAPPEYTLCGYQHFTQYLAGDGNLYRCCLTSYNDHGYLGSVADAGGLKNLLDDTAVRERLNNFDARSCDHCKFNDRNRVIGEAVGSDLQGAEPLKTKHASFV